MDKEIFNIMRSLRKELGEQIFVDEENFEIALKERCQGAFSEEIRLLKVGVELGIFYDLQVSWEHLGLQAAECMARLCKENDINVQQADFIINAFLAVLEIHPNPKAMEFELFTRCLEAAAAGVCEAQCQIAFAYYFGQHGVLQDYAEAAKWYERAALQGNAMAQHNLALMYARGEGVVRNPDMAYFWYKKAALQGEPSAQNNLACMYYDGTLGGKNYFKAVKWYKKAAKQGDAMAQKNLGQMYAAGIGVRKRPKKAFQLFSFSAHQGNYLAQNLVAEAYYNGRGCKKDLYEAAQIGRAHV